VRGRLELQPGKAQTNSFSIWKANTNS